MKTKSKIPMRQCTGCREMKNKKEMIRVLKTAEDAAEASAEETSAEDSLTEETEAEEVSEEVPVEEEPQAQEAGENEDEE